MTEATKKGTTSHGAPGSRPSGAAGNILRIEKASIHDGEGLRNVVFLKGCPMRCRWCSTPESQRFAPEIGVDRTKCASCGSCAAACGAGALEVVDGRLRVLREKCVGCLDCVQACPNRAIKAYGAQRSAQEIADEVSKDEIFYFHSGGGVTLSGGEPCAQPDYAAQLLRMLKARGIDTAMETCLCVPWENVEKLLPYLDSAFVDLKHLDPDEHARITGVGNDLILDNVARLDASPYPVRLTLRVPLIPGLNDGDDNLAALARFARGLTGGKLRAVELLPYHRLGVTTYRMLDMPYPLEDIAPQSWERMQERARFLSAHHPGVPVEAGGQTF